MNKLVNLVEILIGLVPDKMNLPILLILKQIVWTNLKVLQEYKKKKKENSMTTILMLLVPSFWMRLEVQ